jgi:hypothetical protein
MPAFRKSVNAPLSPFLLRSVPAMTDQEREDRDERFRRQPPNVINLLDRLGYDIYDNDDLNRLRRNLDFCEELRKQNERKHSNYTAWVASFLLVVLGSFATAVAQWIAGKFGGGAPHP